MIKFPKLQKWQMVEIHWDDSVHTNGWKHEEDVDFDDVFLQHLSIGYFVNSSKRAITICQNRSDQGDTNIDAIMSIPKGCIRKLRKLK